MKRRRATRAVKQEEQFCDEIEQTKLAASVEAHLEVERVKEMECVTEERDVLVVVVESACWQDGRGWRRERGEGEGRGREGERERGERGEGAERGEGGRERARARARVRVRVRARARARVRAPVKGNLGRMRGGPAAENKCKSSRFQAELVCCFTVCFMTR